MGLIARQTAKNSVVLTIGVAIGALSAVLIYPLQESLYGNIQFIISSALLLMPFADLGVGALVVRFFPQFRTDDDKNRGFMGLIFACILIGLLILGILSWIFEEKIYTLLELIGWNVQRFVDNAPEVALALVAFVFIARTSSYLTNYGRVVWPSILDNLMLKILLPVIILLTYLGYIDYYQGKWLFVGAKLLAALLIIGYVWRLGLLHLKIDFSFLKKERVRSMMTYAGYGFLGSLSSVIAFQIDTVMIAGFNGFSDTGIYGIAAIIANVMIIPSRGINPLVGAQISRMSNENSWKGIGKLYMKSSLTLLIGGAMLLLLIWWNLHDLFGLTQKADILRVSANVVLFLGVARLIDMLTGANGYIIAYSKYFRWNLVFIVLMGALTITSNLYFIPRMGITGAALATLISLSIFNLLKFIFVWYVFKMQPFTWNTLKVIAIACMVSVLLWLIPLNFHPIVNIILRSALVLVLFGLPVYYFRFSEDISQAVEKYWSLGLKMVKLN